MGMKESLELPAIMDDCQGPRPRRPALRLGIARLAAWAVPVLLVGCLPAAAPAAPTISLRVKGGPADATVTIDEETLGMFDFVASHGVALPPGVHYVTITARGYFPWDRRVEAKPGSPPIELDVAMTPVPD
jgi:hypothetical protein